MAGSLYVVATPIGHLEDITLRALETLRQVSLVAAEDTRRTSRLLNHYAIQTRLTSLFEHNEAQKIPGLLETLAGGADVALVSDAGTPLLSDPGTRLVSAAVEAGITVIPVPGPSAVAAALVAAGFASDGFCFLGFPPRRSNSRKTWLLEAAGSSRTCIFFEAPHRIRKTLTEMATILGDRPLCIGREMTKIHEEFLRGSATSILQHGFELKGEFTIVVSPATPSGGPPMDLVEKPKTDALLAELGQITRNAGLSRRAAVKMLAEKYGLEVNRLYKALKSND